MVMFSVMVTIGENFWCIGIGFRCISDKLSELLCSGLEPFQRLPPAHQWWRLCEEMLLYHNLDVQKETLRNVNDDDDDDDENDDNDDDDDNYTGYSSAEVFKI